VLKLGGVEIPHNCGLIGHSDADVLLHAVTDAVLGAAGLDDIGELFPDTDPQYRGADSSVFLQRALETAAGESLRVINCDVTVLAQEPKLAGFKLQIKERLAELLGIPTQRVAVKAKTNELMGFVGRSEGIVAIAAVMLSDEPSG
jgi:2-C-methyl-D-erythritol 2,4-cyclodiphosphate synthase